MEEINDQAAVTSVNESGHFGRLRLVLFWNKIKQNKLQNSCKNLKMILSLPLQIIIALEGSLIH